MRLLVTGGNGFVGKRLCAVLMRQGHSVDISAHSMRSLVKGIEASEVGSIHIDTDTVWAEPLDGINVVIHLAARTHKVNDSGTDDEAEYMEVNFRATISLAEQAAKAGVQRFIFISTIGVNGAYTEAGQAFNELSAPAPHNAYARSKWAAEQGLNALSAKSAMQIIIIRPPLVYGPEAKANFLSLIRLVNSGLPIPLGRLCNLRSFIYLDNLIDALILVATHPAAIGGTYLVCDAESISTPDLIRALSTALGKPCRLVSLPMGLIELVASLIGKRSALNKLSQSLLVDSSKIRAELGWQPKITLQQGLKNTGESFLK